jgi:hypothetical protein
VELEADFRPASGSELVRAAKCRRSRTGAADVSASEQQRSTGEPAGCGLTVSGSCRSHCGHADGKQGEVATDAVAR